MTEIVSASGDDEELKGLLDDYEHQASAYGQGRRNSTTKARAAVESLFGRIREERDRLKAKSESGVNQEGSTARTDAPASDLRCACYHLVTRAECMALRHGYDVKHDGTDEDCECLCHDVDDEDDRDWYAEQTST